MHVPRAHQVYGERGLFQMMKTQQLERALSCLRKSLGQQLLNFNFFLLKTKYTLNQFPIKEYSFYFYKPMLMFEYSLMKQKLDLIPIKQFKFFEIQLSLA